MENHIQNQKLSGKSTVCILAARKLFHTAWHVIGRSDSRGFHVFRISSLIGSLEAFWGLMAWTFCLINTINIYMWDRVVKQMCETPRANLIQMIQIQTSSNDYQTSRKICKSCHLALSKSWWKDPHQKRSEGWFSPHQKGWCPPARRIHLQMPWPPKIFITYWFIMVNDHYPY